MKKLFAVIALTIVTSLAPSRAEVVTKLAPATQPTKTQFVRFLEDRQGGGVLETAAVTYRRQSDGVTVTLIGAVHIADAEYFAGLNASFDHYDALLYEMVKPKDAAPTADDMKKKRKNKGNVSLIWVKSRPMLRILNRKRIAADNECHVSHNNFPFCFVNYFK